MSSSPKVQVWIALAIVYLVWGSTYLAIRIGVKELPPVLFAGLRFDFAAVLMLGYAFARGGRLPAARRDWVVIAVTACALLVGGNGLVTWAERWIDSNQAALIVATSALWIAGMGTLGAQGESFNRATLAGLLLGFVGVALLVGSGIRAHAAPVSAYAGMLCAPLLWSSGSIYARRNPVGCAAPMTAALQMGIAGVVLTIAGLLHGDAAQWHYQPAAIGSLLYLIVFGSCVAYGAYSWLVHQVAPSVLGTYAYVNPAVAVLLGWLVLDETLSRAQIMGTIVILAGVVLVTLASRKPAH
jgi:drug/metabolite transporter (DMT)-like permease